MNECFYLQARHPAQAPGELTCAKMVKFDYRVKNGGQYVLIYENVLIKQVAKRKLYVVMATDGKFVSAGHKLS